MKTDDRKEKEDEATDQPAEAGKKAIEAQKLTNDKNKSKKQQEEEEKADAEKWRNEG